MSNLSEMFVKKPIMVEAEQWIGSNISTISTFMATAKTDFIIGKASEGIIQILTLEGIMTARIGDWIIKGIDEELYPCKDLVFKKTYQKPGTSNHKEVVELSEVMLERDKLKELVRMGDEVISDFLPNIGTCVLQDYGKLNDFLLAVESLNKEST